MNLCELMLANAKKKKAQYNHYHYCFPPALRRQVAGDLDNPYDLTYHGNRDIKLYCDVYYLLHKTNPPADDINFLGTFTAEDNLLSLPTLSTLPTLSKL
jgi:hypothetical protein